jgi:hypothetical protein
MMRWEEPRYIQREQYTENMRVNNELYYVAIRHPAKIVFAQTGDDETQELGDEFIIITMTHPHWANIAHMVTHDMENK